MSDSALFPYQFINEFRGNDFSEFIKTGINVLITTTIKDSFSDDGIEIGVIERVKLLNLYCNKSHCSITPRAEKVIDAVKGNTLLVTLIAGIVKKRQYESENILQELLYDFEILEVERERDFVEDQGGRVRGNDTIYNHLKIVFNIAEINEEEWKAMENAILISNGGISKQEFFGLTNGDYINENQSLINKSWICEDELGDNVQWLSVHPLVREIVYKSEMFVYEDCEKFCKNLYNIVNKVKKENMYNAIAYSENMFQIFQLLKRENKLVVWEIGYLLTEIYEETYFQYDRVYNIALDVVQGIEIWKPHSIKDRIKRCRMINGSAYSLLHTRTEDNNKKKDEYNAAKKYLEYASSELSKIIGSSKEECYEQQVVKALIHGNKGAYYRGLVQFGNDIEKNIENALKEHNQGLECRNELLKDYPEKEAELNSLIATSYHCIGYDYFAVNNFESALENHKNAEKLRKDIYQKHKTVGQKDKWIQSCSMICNTIQNMEQVTEEDLNLYCDKVKVLEQFYRELNDENRLKNLSKNYEEMSRKFDLPSNIYEI